MPTRDASTSSRLATQWSSQVAMLPNEVLTHSWVVRRLSLNVHVTVFIVLLFNYFGVHAGGHQESRGVEPTRRMDNVNLDTTQDHIMRIEGVECSDCESSMEAGSEEEDDVRDVDDHEPGR
ncbi:hypothetical protein MMC07_006193 [Pseudocyphellaria aurata]|nr:hypothetical protein [Pseudocyphellaria aurata]